MKKTKKVQHPVRLGNTVHVRTAALADELRRLRKVEALLGDVNRVTDIVREADLAFLKSGGSSRHWARDEFLPRLRAALGPDDEG